MVSPPWLAGPRGSAKPPLGKKRVRFHYRPVAVRLKMCSNPFRFDTAAAAFHHNAKTLCPQWIPTGTRIPRKTFCHKNGRLFPSHCSAEVMVDPGRSRIQAANPKRGLSDPNRNIWIKF
jgi:hypothetical protein